MQMTRALSALSVVIALVPAAAAAQDGGGIGDYFETLQRQVEEHAPGVLDDAREGLEAVETVGRNLVDRWRVCGDSPQSAAPVCRVLTDGEGGSLDPSPGSLDRLFERLQEIAAPYNERSRAAAELTSAWAEALDLAPDAFSAERAVGVVFDRIRACQAWPCAVLDRDLLERSVIFLEERDTEGYPAARRVRTSYEF